MQDLEKKRILLAKERAASKPGTSPVYPRDRPVKNCRGKGEKGGKKADDVSRESVIPRRARGDTRRFEKGEASDERIRSALERKNVTVVRPQGEEKLAGARH
jgi:hypothetical protein